MPVGPAAAHSPAHDSNLIPQPVPLADQGSTRVALGSSMGEPDPGQGRRGYREAGRVGGVRSWADGVQIHPSGVRTPLLHL